ncbi:MAG TPA: hypothetical protein DDW49_07400 [Deltaproteobacteria bacterium]|nr:hypothetical protein [Deltaproteobacteria bacterium]
MMEAILFISLFLPVYTYFIYPFILVIWGLFSNPKYQRDDAFTPSLTLLISAYNEEKVIKDKLENSLALNYPKEKLEIIVASESTDTTNQIVQQYIDKGIILKAYSGRLGKSATLYRTLPETSGDIIVFSDANALYRPESLRKLARHFIDPSVGCVIGSLQYHSPNRSVGAKGEMLYWAYDLLLRKMANRIRGLIPGINGSIFALRKNLYLPIRQDRGDDFELCTRAGIHGHAVLLEPEAIAEEIASETDKQQFKRKVRLVRWNLTSSLLLLVEALKNKKWAIAFQLTSHRLLRYWIPIFLFLALASTAILASGSKSFTLLLLLQVIFYGMGLLSLMASFLKLRLPSFLLIPSYFLMVNSAAAIALFNSGLGRIQTSTWQKQR